MRIHPVAASSPPASVAPPRGTSRAGDGSLTTPLDVRTVAARAGLSSADLRSFLATGGRMTLVSGAGGVHPAAQTDTIDGLPTGPDGAPDFEAIAAAGGTVRGAIPPDGAPTMTIVDQYGSSTYWAAEVRRPDGSVVFTRGVSVHLDSGVDRQDGLTYLAHALDSLDDLPPTYADFLARRDENWLGRSTSAQVRVDLSI